MHNFVIWVCIIVLSLDLCTGQNVLCPEVLSKTEKLCDRIRCISNIDESDCINLDAWYEPEISLCGCCPGCVKYLGELCKKNWRKSVKTT